MVPTDRCIGRGQRAEEVENPGLCGSKPRADPVALGVGGAAGAGLHKACTGKTGGENPDKVEGRLILHVEQLEDHGSAHTQGRETR